MFWLLFALLTFALAFAGIIPRWEWFLGLFWMAASVFNLVLALARRRRERSRI
jgi:hypothetical protein